MVQITDTISNTATNQIEVEAVVQYLHHWYGIKPESVVCIDKEWQEDYGGWKDEYYFVSYTSAATNHYDGQHMIRVLVNDVCRWHDGGQE